MRSLKLAVVTLLAITWTNVHSRSIQTSSVPIETGLSVNGGVEATQTIHNKRVEVASEVGVVSIAENVATVALGQAVESEINKEVEDEVMKDILAALTQEFTAEAKEEIKSEVHRELEVPSAGNSALETLASLMNEASKESQVSPLLEFESGRGDRDNDISGIRDKRTARRIGRLVTCLFTVFINPQCLQGLRTGGDQTKSESVGSSKQEAFNRQIQQWIIVQQNEIAKLNATEGGNYTTPFPILPPSPPQEDDESQTTQRPGGFLEQVIKFKLNFIPNLFRTLRSLFQSIGPLNQNNRNGGVIFG